MKRILFIAILMLIFISSVSAEEMCQTSICGIETQIRTGAFFQGIYKESATTTRDKYQWEVARMYTYFTFPKTRYGFTTEVNLEEMGDDKKGGGDGNWLRSAYVYYSHTMGKTKHSLRLGRFSNSTINTTVWPAISRTAVPIFKSAIFSTKAWGLMSKWDRGDQCLIIDVTSRPGPNFDAKTSWKEMKSWSARFVQKVNNFDLAFTFQKVPDLKDRMSFDIKNTFKKLHTRGAIFKQDEYTGGYLVLAYDIVEKFDLHAQVDSGQGRGTYLVYGFGYNTQNIGWSAVLDYVEHDESEDQVCARLQYRF